MGNCLCYTSLIVDSNCSSCGEKTDVKKTQRSIDSTYKTYIKIQNNNANSTIINAYIQNSLDDEIKKQSTEGQFSLLKSSDDSNSKNSRSISKEDFNFIKVIGRGSFGKVMLVEKKNSGKKFAMKIIRKDFIQKRNQIVHTKAEKNILQNSQSPFIVNLHYAFQNSERLYLVMDFMNGGELFFHLRRSRRFNESRSKFYIAEIILALEYLHKNGIIYRDLKPENILLGEDGHLKLTDFGLSKQGVFQDEKTYSFCGTPEYLAPEILLGLGHDKSVDWWSLGALLYEMLSGAPPFYSKDKSLMFKNILEKPIEMKPYFSVQAVSILHGLLCLDPEKRLGSSTQDAQEIKSHPFFKDVDWEKIEKKKIAPPFKPIVDTSNELNNFAKIFTDELPKETPIKNSKSQSLNYSNFTYIKHDAPSNNEEKVSFEEKVIENPNFKLE